jgi:hypothetical protein
MNSRRFMRPSSQLEETDAAYQVSMVVVSSIPFLMIARLHHQWRWMLHCPGMAEVICAVTGKSV